MRYRFHVAGAVGVMMAVVMGVSPRDEETLDRACDLGIAFQLANIARDVVEDAAAGRRYLPASWLAEAKIPPDKLAHKRYRKKLAGLARRLADLAKQHRAARPQRHRKLCFRKRWAVLSAAGIYGAIATGSGEARRACRGTQRVHTSQFRQGALRRARLFAALLRCRSSRIRRMEPSGNGRRRLGPLPLPAEPGSLQRNKMGEDRMAESAAHLQCRRPNGR